MLRRAAPLALAALFASACASGTDMGRPGGLTDMRQELSDRRAATRSVMDDARAKPSIVDQAADGAAGVGSFLGRVGDTALDVLTLRALGLW